MTRPWLRLLAGVALAAAAAACARATAPVAAKPARVTPVAARPAPRPRAAPVAAEPAATRPHASAAEHPRRISTTVHGVVDILADLGAMDRVVGIPERCSAPEAADVPVASVETIVAIHTDLLIASPCLRDALAGRQEPVHFTPSTLDLPNLYLWVQDVGDRIGESERARELAASMMDAERRLDTQTRGLPPVRVYHESRGGLGDAACGAHGIFSEMVRLAGGTDIAADLAPGARMTAEEILAADPQVILLDAWAEPEEEIVNRPGWSGLAAVREGRIHRLAPQDASVREFSSRCLAVAEEKFVVWFHPDLFVLEMR